MEDKKKEASESIEHLCDVKKRKLRATNSHVRSRSTVFATTPDISLVGMLSTRTFVLDLVSKEIVLSHCENVDCPRKRDSTGRRQLRGCAIAP